MVPQDQQGTSQTPERRPQNVCSFCQRSFSKNEHLLRHVRSHTKERPFQCKHCLKTYPRQDTLRRHERGHVKASRSPAGGHSPPEADIQDSPSDSTPFHDSKPVYLVPTTTSATSSSPAAREQCLPYVEHGPSLAALEAEFANYEQRVRGRLPAYGHEFSPGSRPATVESYSTGAPTAHIASPSNADPFAPNRQESLHRIESGQAFNTLDDAWLLADDLDIDMLDSALHDAVAEWAHISPLNPSVPSVTNQRSSDVHTPYEAHRSQHTSRPRSRLSAHIASDQNTLSPGRYPSATLDGHLPSDPDSDPLSGVPWHTRPPLDHHGPATPGHLPSRATSEDPTHKLNIDQQYTVTLRNHLYVRQYEESRLSVDYLNMCLRMYYSRFHPIFPVIHFPTFKPDANNAFLFLSMCSIGSLFVGGVDAVSQGHHLYARVNKAILASWETYLSSTSRRSLSTVQAALIGQTFGLLSARAQHLAMSETFQGTLIAWTRKFSTAQDITPELPPENLDPSERIAAWKSWASSAQIQRLIFGLFIHDAELAAMFHHEPVLRHSATQYVSPVSDALFQAPTAEQWYALINRLRPALCRKEPRRIRDWLRLHENTGPYDAISISIQHSLFTAYAVLENISACIAEMRATEELDHGRQHTFTQALIRYYHAIENPIYTEHNDTFSLKILWHSCFIALSTNLNLLERFLGRDGSKSSATTLLTIHDWAGSHAALRSLIHALALKNLVETMQMNTTPAIHVPRTLFSAGLVWTSHLNWRKSRVTDVPSPNQTTTAHFLVNEYLELQHTSAFSQHNLDRDIANIASGTTGQHYHQSIVFGIIELLQRLNRWGISGTFANILKEGSAATMANASSRNQ